MTGYRTQEDILAERFEALLAEERTDGDCCTACRRGTRELGSFPCGRNRNCTCHRKATR